MKFRISLLETSTIYRINLVKAEQIPEHSQRSISVRSEGAEQSLYTDLKKKCFVFDYKQGTFFKSSWQWSLDVFPSKIDAIIIV